MTRGASRPILGIVGGLGPYSHIEFERRLLEAALESGRVSSEQDFPEWILSSIPQTPDRTESIRNGGGSPLPVLLASVRRLERREADGEIGGGADFGVIVCNTAHYFLPRLRELSDLPLLDLVDEAVAFLAATHAGCRVGVLATTGTLESRLYHEPLASQGLHPVSLLDLEDGDALQERLVMRAIYGSGEAGEGVERGVKLGGDPGAAAPRLERAAGVLVERLAAEVLLVGCTEISMVLRAEELWGCPVVDSLEVLARRAIQRIYQTPRARRAP